MKSFVAAALFGSIAQAHTLVRSVYLNGVDQGTSFAIRPPAWNGPPLAGNNPFGQGSGYQNSPVRDLTSVDTICNVLGDIPASDTLEVVPGDTLTFEWGHESRQSGDNVIESSHKGAIVIYISPNPPKANSWVKIFEEGEYAPNQWAVVPKLVSNKGLHSVKIPPNLAPGQYLIRPELITLHEAEVSHTANANRGVQLYMECIQLRVGGSGTVSLPEGVSFPGAYSYSDPGIIYNLYYTQQGAPPYKIPGPTVWAGAAPSVANPALGPKKGVTTIERWSTWVGSDRVVTKVGADGQTTKSRYSPSWPSTYVAPTKVSTPASSGLPPTPTITPPSSSTAVAPPPPPTTSAAPDTGTVSQWGQCGGVNYSGSKTCASPYTCKVINNYYHQCQ